MAITVLNRVIERSVKGIREKHVIAWSTTDTSGTLPTTLTCVEGAAFAAIGAPAGAETFSLDEASHVSADGRLMVSAGAVTLARVAASPTSGLKMIVTLEGY